MAKKDKPGGEAAPEGGKAGGGRKKLLLIALPVLLLGAGGGAWYAGLIPGLGHKPAAEGHGDAHGDGHGGAAAPAPARAAAPVFLDMPEVMTNLNAPGRRAAFIRLRSKLELSKPEDVAVVQAAMPRLLDLFQTYLREVRPEELRGSIGTHRLREELIARASLAAAPARVNDVLFTEMLVQ